MSKEFAKTKWSVDNNDVRLGMEISKVDKKRRMIAGWATLDNVDQEGDQVTAEASLDAFARSRMNLREMHKKDSAVGRIVSFKQDTFRAPDGKEYKGIFVKVYVSKGAEDTWQKVLDKTLNGFSIGGDIVDYEEVFNKSTGTKGKKVTKYNLNELSLVDNPGNEYSDFTHVFKIRGSADGSVTSVTGMIEDCKVLNVYYCENDGITKEVPGESAECPACGEEMEFVDVVEDTADRGDEVSEMVQKFISTEGGGQMTKIVKSNGNDEEETLETVETGHEPGDEREVPTPVDSDITGEEDADEVEEVEDEGNQIAKRIDNLKDDIEKILNDSTKKTAEKIEELEKTVTATREFFDDKISDLDKRISKVDETLETQKSRLSTFEKLLNKVNSGAALRKSADSGNGDSEKQDNSAWNGAFSVKNLVE
jgi:hypothetical protein